MWDIGETKKFCPSTCDKVLMKGVASDSLGLKQKEQLCRFKEDISVLELSFIEHFSCVKLSGVAF